MTTYDPHTPPASLIETLQTLAKGNLLLLEYLNGNDTAKLRAKSYVDLMFLIADIIRVSQLALGQQDGGTTPGTAASISRVLGMALELIPYEEADLLDWFRESFLINPETYDTPLENYFLTKPSGLLGD